MLMTAPMALSIKYKIIVIAINAIEPMQNPRSIPHHDRFTLDTGRKIKDMKKTTAATVNTIFNGKNSCLIL